jgi:membrane protein implicated in regulation of membrane protease activity
VSSFFNSLNGLEIFFMICAITGGILFLVKLIMQFVGSDHDFDHGDGDFGHADAPTDAHADAHADSDVSFKVLSLHGITSFFMMFGLVGFALYRESRVGSLLAIVGAIAAGSASVWVIAKLFSTMFKLQSSGTLDIMSTVGTEGTVYLTIPANGQGAVMVSVKNRLREFDAVSQDKQELKSGARIRVVWVNGNILVVEKI